LRLCVAILWRLRFFPQGMVSSQILLNNELFIIELHLLQ